MPKKAADAPDEAFDDENRVELTKPLKLKDGTEIVALAFREPTVSQLRVRDKWEGEMAKEIAVVGRMARGIDAAGDEYTLGFALIEEMNLKDFTACQRILSGFLGELQPIESKD